MVDFTKACLDPNRLAVLIIVEITVIDGKPKYVYHDFLMENGKENAAFAIYCLEVSLNYMLRTCRKKTNIYIFVSFFFYVRNTFARTSSRGGSAFICGVMAVRTSKVT